MKIYGIILLTACTAMFQGCRSSSPKPPTEQLMIRLTDDVAEVLNVDSLSISAPPDTVVSEVKPEPIYQVAPEYPYSLESSGGTGEVIVKMLITKGGNVRKVVIISTTNRLFNKSVLKAAAMWKFRPAMINGKPANVWIQMPFRFKMRR